VEGRLIADVTLALLLGATLVLAYRFEPSVAIETIRDERPTFTIGSITVFIALMNAPNAERDALASLTKTWSGGAPIPPSAVKAFQAQFGQYIHNAYGLTETTSPSHLVPFDAVAPVRRLAGPGRRDRRPRAGGGGHRPHRRQRGRTRPGPAGPGPDHRWRVTRSFTTPLSQAWRCPGWAGPWGPFPRRLSDDEANDHFLPCGSSAAFLRAVMS
jgi:acyl-CoA synthetase (AMP-forming)/AMP-acid ligase II